MQDPQRRGGQHQDLSPVPDDVDRQAEGDDHSHTPSYLRPPVAGRAELDFVSNPSLTQSRSVEFDLPSPVGPARPKSPWGRFDPYDNNEVT